jgi:DNA-binding transcriptional LysR family regulator
VRRTDLSEGACREPDDQAPAIGIASRESWDDGARLGLSLLDRIGKRAFPTGAGEVLLELEAGVAMVQRLRGIVAGRVRIGTSASISVYLLPAVLRRVHASHPEIELVVVTGNAPEIARAVVANTLDVGIVSLPVAIAS